MTTRRRTGFQDLKEVESVSELESAVAVTEELVETPEQPEEVKPEPEPEPVAEVPEPEPEPKVLPVRLLERPKLPERQRNVPRFSRIKH